MLKKISISFFFLILSVGAIASCNLIKSVQVDWFCERDFESISEFLTGKEACTGYWIIRSNPDIREGLYWSIRLDKQLQQAAQPLSINLKYQRSDQAQPQQKVFLLPHPLPRQTILIGLTGEDWPWANSRLNAWQLQLMDAHGQVQASQQSDAWSLNEAKTHTLP